MKVSITVLCLVIIFEGYACDKRKGVCNFAHQVISVDAFEPTTRYWKIYGYIESGAPYRNPFYVHFNESPQCNNLEMYTYDHRGNPKILLSFACGPRSLPLLSCKLIEFVSNNTAKVTHLPETINTDCKEWSSITRLHMDEDYVVMFGCENGEDYSHYVGLWILIRDFNRTDVEPYSSIRNPRKSVKKGEKAVEKKIHRIIDNYYADIKQHIKFIPNWAEETNCSCFENGNYLGVSSPMRCDIDRLDACVIEKSRFEAITNLMKKHGVPILLILVIVILWCLTGTGNIC